MEVARTQANQIRSRRDAAILAAGAHAASGNQPGNERSMPVCLIGIRQALDVDRLCETDAETLRVKQFDVLDDATREVRVCSVKTCVEDGDRDVASRNRNANVLFRQSR